MLKLSHFQVLHFYLLFYLQNLIFPMYVCMHVCTYVRMYVKTHAKVDIKLFFSCPVLLDFSILFQIFCPGFSEQTIVLTRSSLLQTLIFWQFVYYQSISPVFKENIKQVSCVKIPNLMVLCKQYFPYLV